MKPFQISPDDTLAALNHLVSTHLPHLQLRVYNQTGDWLSDEGEAIQLTDLITGKNAPTFTIRPSMTVAELEKFCREQWGLRVEVYRRNGYSWTDTDYTKYWTLREQSRKGEEMLREAER